MTSIIKYKNINILNSIILAVIYFLLLFTTSSKSYNFFKIYINASISYSIVFFLLAIIFLINLRKIKVDIIMILLFGRAMLFTYGMLIWNGTINYIPRYMSALACFFLYSIFKNIELDKKNFCKYIEIILAIVSMQTIVASFNALLMDDFINNIKIYIRIPLRSSNYISCLIIMFLPIVNALEEKSKMKNFLLILGVIAIVMTRSFSGIVCVLVYFAFYKKSFFTKRILLQTLCLIFAMVVILFFIQYNVPDFYLRYFEIVKKIFSGNITSFFQAFNGRIDIYILTLKNIQNNLLFGVGVGYPDVLNGQLAHNWVLEALIQAGIFNLILLIIVFYKSYITSKKLIYVKECIHFKWIIILVLIQGLVEPNLFAFTFDVFFWSILGQITNIFEQECKGKVYA